MKRTESMKARCLRGSKAKSDQKKQQRQAERAAAKQQLKKDPLQLGTQEKRRLYGWGD